MKIDLIVTTGIADAIAKQLGGLKGAKDAIAETIENNVRSKIIKERFAESAITKRNDERRLTIHGRLRPLPCKAHSLS